MARLGTVDQFLVVVGGEEEPAAVRVMERIQQRAAQGPPPKPPVPVKVDQATSRTVPLQVKAVGNVEACSTVEVRARVSGQLTRVHFQEGQDVRKGAPLFTIDPVPHQIALRQAEARLQKSQALAATAREKERRKYGLKKARKAPQYSKR